MNEMKSKVYSRYEYYHDLEFNLVYSVTCPEANPIAIVSQFPSQNQLWSPSKKKSILFATLFINISSKSQFVSSIKCSSNLVLH